MFLGVKKWNIGLKFVRFADGKCPSYVNEVFEAA